MIQQNLEQLIRVYNTLLLVNTKGEDTILMGDCLKVMKQTLETMQKELAEMADNAASPVEEKE